MSDHPDDTVPDGTSLDDVGVDDQQEARAAFATRLRDVESQPLESRADVFGEIHDELRAVLEGTSDDGQGGR